MKRPGLTYVLLAALLWTAVLFLSGCSLNSQFVSAVDSAWQEIGPEYVNYVDADSNLDEDQKKNRKRTAEILTSTIEVAKQAE